MHKKDTKIVYWCDNLRALAIIGVVTIHVTMNLVAFDIGNTYWALGNFFNGLSRFSVPLFVLISGAFLLSADKDIVTQSFLKKRIIKILIPFIFWNLLYSLYQLKFYFAQGYSFKFPVLITQLKYHWFNGAALHMWYIYVLLGLYLFIPIINKWVRSASEKDFLYFLFLWTITLFFFDKNNSLFSTVSSFSGFIGYLILGYFIYMKDLSHVKYLLPKSLFLFVLGLATTVIGTVLLQTDDGYFNSLLYDFSTPNVALMVMSLFVFAKYWGGFNKKYCLLRVISKYSFGIYFIHIFVLLFLERFGISYNFINPYIGIPITILLCFILSISVLWIMSKIPILKRVSGKS